MTSISFCRRVAVFETGTDRILDMLTAHQAGRQYAEGRLLVRDHREEVGVIAVERAVESHRLTDVRPGSFGIQRQRIAPPERGGSAGIVFSHRPTHERAVAA